MTEIARELLEGVNINDRVKVRYGTSESQDLAEGIVVRISENFLSLQKSDGGAIRIRLDDSLRALEVIMSAGAAPAPIPAGVQILKPPVKLEPAPPYEFNVKQWLVSLRNLVKKFDDATFKSNASSIIAAFEAAVKTNNLGYKYHDVRAKILAMWNDCEPEVEYEFFYQALGVLAVAAQDYDYALEPLARAKKYALAAYSAELALKENAPDVFKLCALLNDELSDITQDVAEICVKRRDVDVLQKLLDKNIENADACEKIFTCAVELFKASGGSLTENIARDENPYVAAKKVLASVPEKWKRSSLILQRWDEYCGYSYPKPAIKTKKVGEKLTGKIYNYKPNRNFGFISPNHYFHVKQIYDNTDGGILLRKMLALNLWNQLEVSFTLGKSMSNPEISAASGIELTAEGIAEAKRRLDSGDSFSTGFIEAFFPQHLDGRIICNEDGQIYKFNTSDMIDPWLRAYYERGVVRENKAVIFKISGLERATEIRWKDQTQEDRETYADFVDEYSVRVWERFLAEQNSAKKKIQLPAEDPYHMQYYCSLQEWTGGDADSKPLPLTWNLRADRSVTPKSAAETFTARSSFVDKARREVAEPRFEETEKKFQSALQREGYSEAIFNDLISLYIRWEGKTDKALELIERYGIYLTKDKLLNAKIRVYEKRKDYAALVQLYEDGIKNTTSVPKQSHYLVSLMGDYFALNRYEEALQTCLRWESFFKKNRFSPEYEKLRQAQTNVNRRKAQCLYCLGRLDEARTIATDLVRAMPLDETANQILNGTLFGVNAVNATSAAAELEEIEENPAAAELVETEENSAVETEKIPADKIESQDFVRYMIEKAAGTGTLSDVERLISEGGDSGARSRNLFAASGIVEQFERRGEATAYQSKLLAGRAFTAWGDYMVSRSSQIDTPRMAYLYAVEMLSASEEPDFYNALNRYLRSFFLAQQGADSLESYVQQPAPAELSTEIFAEKTIPSVLAHEFLIGMLQLILALKEKPSLQAALVEALYEKDLRLKRTLVGTLATFLRAEEAASVEEFRQGMQDAAALMVENLNLLRQKIFELSPQFLTPELSESALNELDSPEWKKCLNYTEERQFSGFKTLLKISQNYYASEDFENRKEYLRQAEYCANDLIDAIQREPTDFSYRYFKAALEVVRRKIFEVQESLYQEFPPQLTWREEIQPYRTPEGRIQIQLAVRNDENCQTAYALKITDVQGSAVSSFKTSPNGINLRGGEEDALIFSIESDGAADNFTLEVSYSYSFSDSTQDIVTAEQSVSFDFEIYRGEIQKLANPFEAYAGGGVVEDSAMFFGRVEELEQIISAIFDEDNYSRAVALYGQARVGKTSVLFHLDKRLRENYSDRLWVWNVGGGAVESLPEFLCSMMRAAVDSAKENAEIRALLEAESLEPPLDDIAGRPQFAVAIFDNYMKKLNRILERERKIIVLLIDEFTQLHRQENSREFLQFWKTMLQEYCIFAVVAGQDDMPEFMRENPNEFFYMRARRLAYLDEYGTSLLIREPLERENNRAELFSDNAVPDKIYELTAGSAFLTVALCSEFVKYLNASGAYKISRGALNDFLETRVFCPNSVLTEEEHFAPQFIENGHEEFEGVNREVLQAIARQSQDVGSADVNSIVCDGLTAEEIREVVLRLVDRNVLIREGDDRYYIQVKLLEKWLLKDEL